MEYIQGSLFGKTSPEPSAVTKEKTSERSSKKRQKWQKGMPAFLDLRTANGHTPDASWEMGGALLGEYTMRSFGECPSEEKESRLSQILQGGRLQKYYLSAKACQGILRRAEKRGKELPKMLKEALEKQASLAYRGDAITSPVNASNPKPGDPCHTLTDDSRNYVVVESSAWDGGQTSPTLTANNADGSQRMPDKENFNAVVQSMEVFHCTTEDDKVQTLKARNYKDPQVVTYGLDRASYNQGQNAKFGFCIDEEKIGAQVAKGPGAVCTSVVRRLTPMECERLQGFPDGWTDIPGATDSKRYKALGNSIALPFWEFLACRFVRMGEVESIGSLFDGIGGFPLVFERAGAETKWTSEIEPFCEEVVRYHIEKGDL